MKTVTEGSSVFLDVHDQESGKDKLHHDVSGPFHVRSVDILTETIQIRGVVYRVSLDRLVVMPKYLSTYDKNRSSAIAINMHAKDTQGSTFTFKGIAESRENSDRGIEFKTFWEGEYLETWEPRTSISEDAISR